MFRKSGPLEPYSHSMLRGAVALAAWTAIIAFAIFNCVINPVRQFTKPKGLPTRSLLQDSHAMTTYGNITGFIVLDVVPVPQATTFVTDDGKYSQEMEAAILAGITANVMNSSTNEGELQFIDRGLADGTGINWSDGGFTDLQIEVQWDCGAIWVSYFCVRTELKTLCIHILEFFRLPNETGPKRGTG
ncbi:hypothetical protein FRC00_007310 [Tulasnella sp. 408]|nr:hypothetical protein FRC00_007310 [Tulasnella sp. 408]